jgi:TldD protein
MASIGVEQKIVLIVNSAGVVVGDIQPLVRLSVTCIAESEGDASTAPPAAAGRVEFTFSPRATAGRSG